MSRFITKVFIHPLFRFFFWLVAAVWLFLMGLSGSGFFRWIDFILAVIFIGLAIENVMKTVKYFKKDHNK